MFAKEVRIILMMTKHLKCTRSFETCNNATNFADLLDLTTVEETEAQRG